MQIGQRLDTVPKDRLEAFASSSLLTNKVRECLLNGTLEVDVATWDRVIDETYAACENMKLVQHAQLITIDNRSYIASWFTKKLNMTLLAGTKQFIAYDRRLEVHILTLPVNGGTIVVVYRPTHAFNADSNVVFYVPMPEVKNQVKHSAK